MAFSKKVILILLKTNLISTAPNLKIVTFAITLFGDIKDDSSNFLGPP